ncbi:hypothetical protein HQQ92_22825 [Shewanella sp. DC2-4]|uniref:hypothetical protein n=1 Tax=Shewanella sp. DC2-4 TaxID=2739431 RepID=UPI0015674EFC|nr:hypothetical protein [Shewanella sp. DC2-4]NRD34551.1 hypothetical protein [Shewanella sp. DC2-4]
MNRGFKISHHWVNPVLIWLVVAGDTWALYWVSVAAKVALVALGTFLIINFVFIHADEIRTVHKGIKPPVDWSSRLSFFCLLAVLALVQWWGWLAFLLLPWLAVVAKNAAIFRNKQ